MNRGMRIKESGAWEDIHYVKLVAIGCMDPGVPLAEQARAEQEALLNRCLTEYPRGVIIGKDVAVGRYLLGGHELVMEKVTYHVGFSRKPAWEEEKGGRI